MELRQATRQQAKLRVGLSGPAGSGKTYSALNLASGMAPWEKIVLIDSENGRGELYSHLGPYQYLRIQAPYTPEKYIEAIKFCESAGMEIIIIDSVSHEWEGEGGCLEAHSKIEGNSYTAWNQITPRHNRFLQAILSSPAHVITTARRKQDYVIEINDKGKSAPRKIGLKEVQRDGFEYELTLSFDIDISHYAKVSKAIEGIALGEVPFKITKEVGQTLMKWANEGDKPIVYEASHSDLIPDIKRDLRARLKELGAVDDKTGAAIINGYLGTKFKDVNLLTDQQAGIALEKLTNDLPF